MKKLFFTAVLLFAFSINVFANDNKIPLTPTVTPLRIFFAVIVVAGFVAAEIFIEKKREERVATRPERAEKKKQKKEEKKNKQ